MLISLYFYVSDCLNVTMSQQVTKSSHRDRYRYIERERNRDKYIFNVFSDAKNIFIKTRFFDVKHFTNTQMRGRM